MKISLVKIENIVLDPRLQGRVTLDMALIQEYQEHWEELPPVDLYEEEQPRNEQPKYYPGDGWHRINATKAAGVERISAKVHPGGYEAALLHAVRANTSKTHGAKRTSDDKQRAIEIYMTNGEWYKHSDSRIGKACEVDHKTVTAARERLEKEGKIPVTTERIGLDGKTQPAKQQKQGGNSHPETQPSLLINNPVQSSQRVAAVFDEAEQKKHSPQYNERDASICRDGSVDSENKTTPADPIDSVANDTKPTPADPIPEGATLHKLLRAGEIEQNKKGWPLLVQIPGQKKDHTVTEALTLLPDADVKIDVAQDNESGFFAAFTGTKLQNYLCSVSSEPPRPETKAAPSKSQAKTSEGVEDSTPSKKNGEGYQHYCSPPALIEPTKLIAKIGADFCHNKDSLWGARVTVDETQDSLSFLYPWADMLHDDEIAPLNPPWNNMEPFVDKLIKEAARGKQWLLIGPAGSSSAVWYHEAANNCAIRIEPDKRLKYYKEGVEDPNPRDATALFYFGRQVAKVAAIFGRLGWLVTKRVDPADYAEAAEQLRKEALDARQQGLPGMAAPEENESKETHPGEPPAGMVFRPDPAGWADINNVPRSPQCQFEGCPNKRAPKEAYCFGHTFIRVEEFEADNRLYVVMRKIAIEYESRGGYSVTVEVPKHKKRKTITEATDIFHNYGCAEQEAYRTPQEYGKPLLFEASSYAIPLVEPDGRTVICTLHAVHPAKNVPNKDEDKEPALPFVCMHSACKGRRRYESNRAFWKHQKESHSLTSDLRSLTVVHVGDKAWMSIQDTYGEESVIDVFGIDPSCQCVWAFDSNGIHQRPYVHHTITLQKGRNYLMGSSRVLIGSFNYECHDCKEVFLGDDCELRTRDFELWPICEDCRNKEASEPNEWLERELKAFEDFKTREEAVSLYEKLIEKAQNNQERERIEEVFKLYHAKLPHAENGRFPRKEAGPKKIPGSHLFEGEKIDPAHFKQPKKTAPKPQRNKGKNEEPPKKKNNPAKALTQKKVRGR